MRRFELHPPPGGCICPGRPFAAEHWHWKKSFAASCFVNNRNHLALTEKGERFRALGCAGGAAIQCPVPASYQDIQSAPLRLGISVALFRTICPIWGRCWKHSWQQYPRHPLGAYFLSNDEVPVQLQRGALDAGLVMDLGGCAAGLARTALSQHTAAVMVCRSSPFWERTHITPAELDGQTLLVPGFCPGCPGTAVAGTAGEQCTPTAGAGRAILSGTLPHAGAELCISEPFREIFQQPDVQCPGCNIRRSAAYLCRIPPSPKTTQRLCGAIVPLFAGEVEVLKRVTAFRFEHCHSFCIMNNIKTTTFFLSSFISASDG